MIGVGPQIILGFVRGPTTNCRSFNHGNQIATTRQRNTGSSTASPVTFPHLISLPFIAGDPIFSSPADVPPDPIRNEELPFFSVPGHSPGAAPLLVVRKNRWLYRLFAPTFVSPVVLKPVRRRPRRQKPFRVILRGVALDRSDKQLRILDRSRDITEPSRLKPLPNIDPFEPTVDQRCVEIVQVVNQPLVPTSFLLEETTLFLRRHQVEPQAELKELKIFLQAHALASVQIQIQQASGFHESDQFRQRLGHTSAMVKDTPAEHQVILLSTQMPGERLEGRDVERLTDRKYFQCLAGG